MYKKFEKRIKELGITPYRVAKATEISTSTLSDWKNNKSKPKVDKLIKISTFLGIPLEELIKEE